MISLGCYLLSYVLYVILHELTHGAAYKLFTKEKLTYGLTLTVAYCGVPTIYLKKKAAYIATLAPFVVFSASFAPLVAITYVYAPDYVYLACSLLFASHIAGCIGDLYVTAVLLFRYTGKDVIVNDTGPTQTFYVKKEGGEGNWPSSFFISIGTCIENRNEKAGARRIALAPAEERILFQRRFIWLLRAWPSSA